MDGVSEALSQNPSSNSPPDRPEWTSVGPEGLHPRERKRSWQNEHQGKQSILPCAVVGCRDLRHHCGYLTGGIHAGTLWKWWLDIQVPCMAGWEHGERAGQCSTDWGTGDTCHDRCILTTRRVTVPCLVSISSRTQTMGCGSQVPEGTDSDGLNCGGSLGGWGLGAQAIRRQVNEGVMMETDPLAGILSWAPPCIPPA